MREPPAVLHYRDGHFFNPWPDAELHGFGDFLKWRLGERRTRGVAASPPYGSLPTRAPTILSPRAASGTRAVTWIGHSTVLLQLGPVNVLTDPVWSERASPVQWIGPRRIMPAAMSFDALPPIDVVLLSHNHYDHLDTPTVKRIARRFTDAVWLCPMRVGSLLRSLGVARIVERDWWQTVDAPAFTATCTPAQHFSGRGLRDRNKTLWCGWTIAADEVRVFFAGDTAIQPEFENIARVAGPFDLVMLPIGAYDPRWFMRAVHADPADAVAAYRGLTRGVDRLPPCLALHWGTFRLTDEPVSEPPALFAEEWKKAGLPADANWTFAHGESRRFAEASR